ncbi:class I tRNA ligase family protein [Candidatus Gracilibacteria bacterium]|nr:class I tRNA ligase family protein [Candidatus Gracilibacteria bacterium]
MDKAYDHKSTEDKIYQSWEDAKLMNANNTSQKKQFTIPLPPPNVTGQLHLGHAAMLAIEDTMIRYKKMTGHEVLWVPGTDHAAIATENVVLKHLGMQNREEMSREKFLEECKKFAQEKHDRIVHQIKKMGSWLDWSREAYTFDDERNYAVNTIFKMLYEDGLIVRGHRMINWSVGAQSVLSDDEVEYREVEGGLYHYKYFFTDSPKEYLEVATTRPETIFGDTAVALHPKDKRAKKFVGKKVLVPFSGREIPVIADEHVDLSFGTATLKVTPAHDPNDFEIGERHNLPKLQVIGFDGTMLPITEVPKEFHGKTREHCRVELTKPSQWFVKKVPHTHNIGFCYRSETVVEPMLSPQWFVSVEKEFTDKWTGEKTTLKKLTQDAVRKGDVKIIPERFEKTYFQWIDNLRDWCISRQIWWGHRIPVWYDEKGTIHIPEENIVFLARHGESEWNAKGIMQGSTKEVSLTEKGRAQALKLAHEAKHKKIKKIICSNLDRARETAEIIQKELGIKNLEIWPELHEIDFGHLEGKSIEKTFGRTHVTLMDKITKVKEGTSRESFDHLISRGKGVLEKLAKEKNVLVISHGAMLGVLFALHEEKSGEGFDEFCQGWSIGNAHLRTMRFLKFPEGKKLHQDPDTLDTWFSSALWPFSTLGWPDTESPDYQKFYPTDVLETGWDILFFWVARMIMFGRYATGKYPFHTVYLHGLVCDEKGQKMSKSKGNGIDPIDMIDEFGADAVRLSLVVGTSPENPIPIGKGKISGYRNFVNKLWNAGRFVKMQTSTLSTRVQKSKNPGCKSLADKWILSRLARVSGEIATYLQKYEISAAGDKIYHFVWDEFCDWYIEASKVEPNPEFLKYVFLEILKLVHPLCPFVTETLWKELGSEGFLIEQTVPKIDFEDKKAEKVFEEIQNIVTEIRRVRSEKKLNPKEKLSIQIAGKPDSPMIALIETLAGGKQGSVDTKKAVKIVVGGFEIFIDVPVDEGRIEKEKTALEAHIKGLDARLKNKAYIEKAPRSLVDQTKKELSDAKEKLKKLS